MAFESGPLPTPVPTRKITKAEVVSLGVDHYGVAFEYDEDTKRPSKRPRARPPN
jgi:hypothetical protein